MKSFREPRWATASNFMAARSRSRRDVRFVLRPLVQGIEQRIPVLEERDLHALNSADDCACFDLRFLERQTLSLEIRQQRVWS